MPGERYHAGSVSGYLHEPAQTARGGLVLTHGAGLNCESPLLVSVASAMCDAGILVLRCDLRFRQKRPVGPPSPAGAPDDREGLREAVEQLGRLTPGPISLGGHSYGGRQSSILMAEPSAPPVEALLLLSYPLHPPRKPEQLRTEHFARLQTPALFFHGLRDPFGSPDELRTALKLFPPSTPTTLVLIDNAGHELSPGTPAVAELCAHEFTAFLDTLAKPNNARNHP